LGLVGHVTLKPSQIRHTRASPAVSESIHGREVGGAPGRLRVDPTFPISPPVPTQIGNGSAFQPIPSRRCTLSMSAATASRRLPCDPLRVAPPCDLPSLLCSFRDKLGRLHERLRPLAERRQSRICARGRASG
jgi:hypothetical protein